jgi:hypothetical protein
MRCSRLVQVGRTVDDALDDEVAGRLVPVIVVAVVRVS